MIPSQIRCVFLTLLWLVATSVHAADPAKLAEVLGNVADWKITPAEPVLSGKPGQTTLSSPEGLNLESTAIQSAPTECVISYRLKPSPGNSTSIMLQMACAERPDKSPQSLIFSVSATDPGNSVNYTASVQSAKPPPSLAGVLHFDAVTDRSLTWSEEMRKSIEAQIAASPKVKDSLLTLRCTVEKNRFRCWLNGRFVSETPLAADTNLSGLVKVQVAAGAELASILVRPLADVSNRFEPLSIAGNLNAVAVGRYRAEGVKPLPDKVSSLHGVPFWSLALSAKGEDHVDVGTSWTRFGALPGYFPSNSDTFGGRWTAADRIDPARIAMYIPQGRYKALHLLAVTDGHPDSVPVVTAQFYRPDAGHPFNFAVTVPAGKPPSSSSLTELHHVTIPLDPDSFSWFSDLGRIGMEITKQVQYYRAYPDPLEYSWHGAGLPSSVQIYAMTLERVGVDVDIQPDQYGHVWTAPAQPKYTIQLRNSTGAATTAKLVITTKSYDGKDTTRQEKEVALPADDAAVKVPIALKPTRYGLQEVTVECTAGDEKASYRRNFAYLHPDTRDHTPWESGRGSILGFWPLGGGHDTPSTDKEISIMATAGAETSTANYAQSPPEIKALVEKYHFICESAFTPGVNYYTTFTEASGPKYDPANPEKSGKELVEAIRKTKCEPSATSRPTYMPFFTEPNIWPITTGIWPSHYGEDYQLTKPEQATFDDMLAKYLAGARAVRKEWPKLKLLMPYGDPMNTVVFLKLSPESRDLIDGIAIDIPGFERMPEQQVNQVVMSRMYPMMKDLKEYKKDPYLVMTEGFAVSSKDIDTGQEGQADTCTRDFLLLMGYGVTRFEAGNSAWDCANYWGENHYGAGWCSRIPLAMPKLAYVNYATISRQLNRANFTKYIPTGSTSTYCEQFKHYKTGKLIHVLWTLRGTRPVSVKVPPGTTLDIYDQNDNATTLKEKDGVITFTVNQSPQYLDGLKTDAVVTLGESDHSDAKPAKEFAKIGSLGDGSWKLVEKEDLEYTKNKPLQIERFPGKMSASALDPRYAEGFGEASAPGERGGPTPPGYVVGSKALAVHLEKQAKDRGVMPFYTTLEPKSPITIPGKASHLGLWVRAASDCGRVVYSLRDAKGEKWISVGAKEEWNNDDVHAWSAFCFDGWRYLRFELPSSAPYDSFREHGTSWWGSYGGDGVVDLPLKLEKIIVERRPKVIYGNDLVEAKPDDVLLGDLNAEYANATDKGDEAVRLSKLRMPAPKGMPELANPIAEMAKNGTGAPTKVLRVTDPGHQYDGTRCHVHFDPVAGAKGYDVWVSPYPDGRGAIQLGAAWTESGQLIQGLRPDVEFHVFVTYTDKDGKLSKPSAPFRFMLKDRFGYK